MQTTRQKEIERIARELVAKDPAITQDAIARAIGIHPSRLCRLRKRGRVVVALKSDRPVALDGIQAAV